jgi:hypothetical protein
LLLRPFWTSIELPPEASARSTMRMGVVMVRTATVGASDWSLSSASNHRESAWAAAVVSVSAAIVVVMLMVRANARAAFMFYLVFLEVPILRAH